MQSQHSPTPTRPAPEWAGIQQLSRSFLSGDLSPVTLAEALLDRIARLDPTLHAFREVTRNRALEEATASARRYESGVPVGPLDGIPYAAKDLFDVAGVPTTAGSELLAGNVAARDSAVVERLSGAGMVLLGKTHTVEFAYGGVGINHPQGTPHNPWHREHHIPGGSSSGSGVAVAAGFAPMALGTDTGGSVRIPAALCGTVGLKTTFGGVSRAGVFPLSRSLDSVGPLVRSVMDAALTFDAMRGPDARDPEVFPGDPESAAAAVGAGVAGMRLLLPSNFFWDRVEAEVETAVRAAAERLARLGAEVEEAHVAVFDELEGGRAVAAEAFALHRERLATSADRMDPVVASRIVLGADVPAHGYLESLAGWARARARLIASLDGMDALLVPTTAIPAIPVAEADASTEGYRRCNAALLRNTAAGNILGLCGLSVPCGTTGQGLPIGLMIYGKPFREADVLRVGAAWEAESGWLERHPDLGWIEGAA